MARPATTRRVVAEDGTGIVGSVAGVLVFLALVLFASHVLLALYARSVVNAAGFDAARHVASGAVDHGDPTSVGIARRRAEARLRDLLGPMGRDAELTWASDGSSVSLRVEVAVPGVRVPGLPRPSGWATVDRTFSVRVEALR